MWLTFWFFLDAKSVFDTCEVLTKYNHMKRVLTTLTSYSEPRMGLLLGKVLFTSQMTDTSVNMSTVFKITVCCRKD